MIPFPTIRALGTLVALALLAQPLVARSPDYVVQADGAGGAFTSAQTAVDAAVAAGPQGRIIELRADTPGATQVFDQTLDLSGVNLASTDEADWLTIRVREGDTVRFRSSTVNSVLLRAAGASRGWKLEGSSAGHASLQFGDRADYDHAGYKTCYPQAQGANIASTCSNYAIRRVQFTGGRSYTGNSFAGADYELDTVAVFNHGTNALHLVKGRPPAVDWGDAAIVHGTRVKLRRLGGQYGGHNCWTFFCTAAVIRDSDFDGYWTDVNGGGSPKAGSRCTVIAPVSSDRVAAAVPPYGPVLMEGCVIHDSGDSGDQPTQAAMKTEGNHLVLRDNFFSDIDSHLWQMNFTAAKQPATRYFSNYAFYHNTSYVSKGTWWANFSGYRPASGDAQFENNLIANNLFQQVADNDKSPVPGGQILRYDTAGVSFNGHPNGFHGAVIRGNIVGGPSARKNVHLLAPGGGAVFALDDSGRFPANVFANTIADVTFAAPGAPRHRTKAGFAVTNWGRAAGDAPALATITAASTGATIAVDNARPFFDGWGIRGEVGDYLYLGATAAAAESAGPVRIASINYANNTLTLTAARSVTSGQGVWFGGNPANGAPAIRRNRGAFVAPAAR